MELSPLSTSEVPTKAPAIAMITLVKPISFRSCIVALILLYNIERKYLSRSQYTGFGTNEINKLNSNPPDSIARPLLMKHMMSMIYAYKQEEQTPKKPISPAMMLLFLALGVLNNPG